MKPLRITQLTIKQIKFCTDNDRHTDALLLLAINLKERKLALSLNAIQVLHDDFGQMPGLLAEHRAKIRTEIFEICESKLAAENFNDVKSAF